MWWPVLCLVACSFGVNAHTCLHESMNPKISGEQDLVSLADLSNSQRQELAKHFDHMKKKRAAPQVSVAPFLVHVWQPLRVKLDYRFLVPSNDPLGLCRQAGDWVTLGRPANRDQSAPDHKPECEPECGSTTAGCNCWYQCTQEDILWQQRKDFLVDELFPRAQQWLQEALSVRRLPLTLTRTSCGCGSDDLDLDKAAGDTGKLAAVEYKDYTDHDMVLFVSVRSNRLRGKDTLAYACSCQDDWYGRPVFGHINWGANAVNFVNKDKFAEQLGVAIHEITHALGFTSNKYNYYLDNAALEAAVTAGSYNWPQSGQPVPQIVAPRIPEDQVTKSVVRTVEVNGASLQHEVQLLITANAVAKAKEHYGCNNMDGVELENGGAAGTVASHWEKRTMENEFMTGSAAYNPRRSAITLGFFADMGYYQVNYAVADSFSFGRDEGCDFVRPRCDRWAGPYRCEADERSHWGCIWDRTARGVCTVVEYSQSLDPFFQYFPDKPTFGGSQLSDFCPFFRYDENLNADCTQPIHQGNNFADRAETFSPSSRCLDSTLLSKAKQGLVGSAGCHPLRCRDGNLYVRVLNEFYLCEPNKEIRVDGYNGRLKCPPSVELTLLCQNAPQIGVNEWPTVTAVQPRGGTFQSGDTVTVTGTNLANATKIFIGDFVCSDIQPSSTKTTVVCTFDDMVVAEDVMEEGGIFDSVVNFFTSQNQEAAELVSVHVELGNGLVGSLVDGFDVANANSSPTHSPVLLSAITPLILLLLNFF